MSSGIRLAAHVRHRLVVAYAWPRELLEPLAPAGVDLETYGALGFVAVVFLHAVGVRPSPLPASAGVRADLIAYRLLVRHPDARGRPSRGFSSLRGEADGGRIVRLGCLLTAGRYRRGDIRFEERPGVLEISARTEGGTADVDVVADLASRPAPLPPGSPFPSVDEARHIARAAGGVHPGSGQRRSTPAGEAQPISVDVRRHAFFDARPFDLRAPKLAFAFHDADVEYVWERAKAAQATPLAARMRGPGARRWSPRPGEVPTPP